MERAEITAKLTEIFRNVFTDANLVITDTMNANDVDNWTSLTNMIMMSEVENTFGIKFKLRELNKLKTVGDLIATIESKI